MEIEQNREIEHPEEANHLFLHCKIISQPWNLIFALLGVCWTMHFSTQDYLMCWEPGIESDYIKKGLKIWNTISQAICTAWLEKEQ